MQSDQTINQQAYGKGVIQVLYNIKGIGEGMMKLLKNVLLSSTFIMKIARGLGRLSKIFQLYDMSYLNGSRTLIQRTNNGKQRHPYKLMRNVVLGMPLLDWSPAIHRTQTINHHVYVHTHQI